MVAAPEDLQNTVFSAERSVNTMANRHERQVKPLPLGYLKHVERLHGHLLGCRLLLQELDVVFGPHLAFETCARATCAFTGSSATSTRSKPRRMNLGKGAPSCESWKKQVKITISLRTPRTPTASRT